MLRKRIHREADNKVGAWRRAAVWGSRGPLSRLHSLVVAHWPNRRRHVRWSCLGKGLRGLQHNCWRRTELPARLFFSRHNHPGFWLCVGGGPPLPPWWLGGSCCRRCDATPCIYSTFHLSTVWSTRLTNSLRGGKSGLGSAFWSAAHFFSFKPFVSSF